MNFNSKLEAEKILLRLQAETKTGMLGQQFWLKRELERIYAEALEEAAQVLEREFGPGIDALPDTLPEVTMKTAARNRLGLCKSNIRALLHDSIPWDEATKSWLKEAGILRSKVE